MKILTLKSSVIRQKSESENGFFKKTKHAKYSKCKSQMFFQTAEY